MKVDKILIVGGGSAGWMTAAALAYKFPEIKLTLVESKRIGTIGVGESTLGHINRYFDMLDMRPEEWMPECNATFKASIQFTDFREKDSVFQYPFGGLHSPLGLEVQNFFDCQALLDNPFEPEDLARTFSLNGYMAEKNKMSYESMPEQGFIPELDIAYHMDAAEFGEYLRKRFCDNVEWIDGVVSDVIHDNGEIIGIELESGDYYEADLFIDCTGFKSLLLEKVAGSEYVPFKTLLNDRAIAARIPYKDEDDKRSKMNIYTDCKALSAGWAWRTPLWSRMGTGYVYSSKFLSQEEAEAEFRKEVDWDGEVNHIFIKHGYHKQAWKNNVIGVGLSYGFIEPLESTGLLTIHENIIALVEILARRNRKVNSFDRQQFNDSAYELIRGMSDFVALHYGMSLRDDTPYWNHVTTIEYDIHADDIIRKINLASDMAKMYLIDRRVDNKHDGIVYVATGMGYSPTSNMYLSYLNKRLLVPISEIEKVRDKLIATRMNRDAITDRMQSHYDYLNHVIYKNT